MLARGAFLAAIVLAAALRFPALAARPMHADEAIHADKLGTLLEGGGYAYDPAEYHGPTLYYLALLPAWARGQRTYAALDEVTLRLGPALMGVALVGAHAGARGVLGPAAAALAALIAAASPAMVYYSRSFIHETALVLFSFGALLGVCRYLRAPGFGPAIGTGICAGLMLATKETAAIALGCMALAYVLARVAGRRAGNSTAVGRHALAGAVAAAAVAALLFSSFFTHAQGVIDAVRAYAFYLDRAAAASWHVKPWSYYLALLFHFPAEGAPFWTEAAIVLLAVFGAAAARTPGRVPAADPLGLRFLAFYTLLMIAAYAAIPYKTPWCLLGFLHGLILLAGAGAVWVVRSARPAVGRGAAACLVAAATAHLGWQAMQGSFRFASDPRNPYVYAHTGADVFEIVERVRDLCRAHPDGAAMPVQVISRENLWPLPFYLRDLRGVQWWTGVDDRAPNAPVVLVTPDVEPALVRKLYEVPPPGERELYISVFDRSVELRPQVEIRGYAASGLWDAYRRLE